MADKPKSTDVDRRLIRLATAAHAYDTCTMTLRRDIAAGRLTGYRKGRLLYVDPDELRKMFQPVVPIGGGPDAD